MTNTEILTTLANIAKRLDKNRTVTPYTSNEGAVAAHNALHLLEKIQYDQQNEHLLKAVTEFKKNLNHAIQLNDNYQKKGTNSFGNPSASPIETQHAIELFLFHFHENNF